MAGNVAASLGKDISDVGVVYVYFTSGEVVKVSPASSVAVRPDRVIVYDGLQPVASYRRSEVFSCSRTQESPAFT